MDDSIELMHSDPEFSQDVANSFRYLINKHKLQITADGIYSVCLDNKYCRLNFNMDRYDMYNKKGFLIKRLSRPYGIIAAAMAVCPDRDVLSTFPKTTYGDRESIIKLLDWHAELIEACLQDAFKKRFDWERISGC